MDENPVIVRDSTVPGKTIPTFSPFFILLILVLLLLSSFPLAASYDFSVKRNVTGTHNVVVITAQFLDKPASSDVSDIEKRVFSEMSYYYQNVSYGKIAITGNISETWILLPQNMTYYGNYNGENLHSQGAQSLINDAIKYSDSDIDFSAFDYILVVHAGEDEADSQEIDDIWSWGFWEGLSASTDDGVTFDQGAVVSEFDSLGMFCHEFGHILGLPDLYNYDNSSQFFVGNWGLMGFGSCNGYPIGSEPSHILSWGKMFLGWINSSQVIEMKLDQSANVTIDPLEIQSSGAKVVKIPITSTNYYLIAVRIDDNLPDQGVIITLVNETKNSGEGIVRVVDFKPLTSGLHDAALHVGDIFEETQNRFSVKVLEQFENSSCLIQVSNKLVPYINIIAPSRVEAFQGFTIRVEIADYRGTPLQGLMTTLSVNGQKQTTMTDANGTATFIANLNPLMLGERSINIHVEGGEYYMNHQATVALEVIFPTWLLILIFILASIFVIITISYIRARATLKYDFSDNIF